MSLSGEQSKISLILENSILPWVARWGVSRVFVTAPQWKRGLNLPEGMKVTQRPMLGKRIPKRSGRPYGGATVVNAEWPEDQLHSARTPKLCFILAGPVAYRIADYVVHCKPGHGLLIPAGVPFANGHGLNYLDETQPNQGLCEILQILPYNGGLLCWKSRSQMDSLGMTHKSEETCSIPHSAVSFYLDRLMIEATTQNLHNRIVCNSLLNIAMALLHRELQQLPIIVTGEIDAVRDVPPSARKEYSIEQAQAYIHNNLREPLTIERVARFVCMSRTAFTEQFRLQTGKTFTEYVIEQRFQEACSILVGTDLAVRHVSSLVGLKPNRMRVLFHEREGISPTEFRRHCKKRQV